MPHFPCFQACKKKFEQRLKISHIRENKKEEERAIEAIDENPKYFYRYAQVKALIKASIGPLKKMDGSEDLVTNNAEMVKSSQSSMFLLIVFHYQMLNHHQTTMT